jgi:hypothetical protein
LNNLKELLSGTIWSTSDRVYLKDIAALVAAGIAQAANDPLDNDG